MLGVSHVSMLFPGQKLPKKQLTIELVPATSWFKNARTVLSKAEWDVARKQVYKAAGHVCEICGDQGPRWPVECHEVWTFEDARNWQKLERLQALCPDCHLVKHYGFAQIKGWEKRAFDQLCKVNEWSKLTGQQYVGESFKLWQKRSQKSWTVDITNLSQYGIDPYVLGERSLQKASDPGGIEDDIME